MATTVGITLDKPLFVDGGVLAALTMRAPTWADRLAASCVKGDGPRGRFFLARLCGLHADAFRDIGPADAEKLAAAFAYLERAA